MTAFALELLDLDASRAEWSALAERSGNVFATWEWHSTWWRHYGHGRRLLATAVRAPEGELQAILPLYVWRERPLRIVRFLGHGPGDELGPICAPEHRSAAAEALRQVLARERAKVFVGEQLHGDAGWAELLRAHTLTRAGSPVLRFGGRDWEGAPSHAQLEPPRAGPPQRTQALSRPRRRLPGGRERPGRRPRHALRPARRAVGRRLRLRSGRSVPTGLRGRGGRARMDAVLVPRRRRRASRGVVRLPLRRRRVVLPGGPRSGLGPCLPGIRPARPHDSRSGRRRAGRVPLPARRRELQVPVCERRPRARNGRPRSRDRRGALAAARIVRKLSKGYHRRGTAAGGRN